MTRNPILKVLSTLRNHKVKALLMGGQACILYGAAEFSRDIDIAVMVSSENLDNLRSFLKELKAEQIFFPDLSADFLSRGHACHFRCQREDIKGMRIDIMSVMRGMDSFSELWKRREELSLPGIGKVAVMGLYDLVKSKKTQRDKDWPMNRRLIEADIYNAPDDPSENKIRFWLNECRTSVLLISLTAKYPEIASSMIRERPLLKYAIEDRQDDIQALLRKEEDKERKLDHQYWKPLRAELEKLRCGRRKING